MMKPDVLMNAGLGTVFALGIAFIAYKLIGSWGGAYWIHTAAVAVVLCALALLRGRRAWPAARRGRHGRRGRARLARRARRHDRPGNAPGGRRSGRRGAAARVHPRPSGRHVGNLADVTVPDGWVRGASAAGLGAVLLAAIAVQAVAIAQSWGTWYWLPGGVFAAAVCGAALAGRGGRCARRSRRRPRRGRHRRHPRGRARTPRRTQPGHDPGAGRAHRRPRSGPSRRSRPRRSRPPDRS
ncbi:hypothetical protein [Actinomadura sp. CNU-125]|uniref:hypothetical protein n=1 Tax=Actinomadura sp. CNU-125 TaxID=1904961 RepID=UPI0021CC6EEF|nr:hypothetical protein [Actinomadura sp. CNU-125]